MSRRRKLFLLAVISVLLFAAYADYFTRTQIYKHTPYTEELGLRIGRLIEPGVPDLDAPLSGNAHRKKFYTVWSRSRYHPVLTFYGVTAPKELADAEMLARKAIAGVPEITGVTLRFYESMAWEKAKNGFERRDVNLLKEVTIASQPST